MMKKNLRGEVKSIQIEDISLLDFELIDSVARALSISTAEETLQLKNALYPNLMCAAAKSNDIKALERLRATVRGWSIFNTINRILMFYSYVSFANLFDIVACLKPLQTNLHLTGTSEFYMDSSSMIDINKI